MTVTHDHSSEVDDREPDDLAERYGRTNRDSRWVRVLAIATAIGFAVVLTAWLIWGGLLGAPAQLEARNSGYTILGDDQIEIRWNLTVPPGTPTQCAVQALNERFAAVGWKVVDVPASEQRTRTLSELVRTTERADSGLIYRCWLN